MEIALITNETLPLFLALLPPAEQQLLCHDPTVFAIGAGVEGQACGVLLLRSEDTTNEILYISVSPSCRRQGVATAMIEHLRDAVGSTDASLGCTFAASDYSSPLCSLFLNCEGFDVWESQEDEGFLFEVALEDVETALSANWVLPQGERIERFYSLLPTIQQQFWGELASGGYGHAIALQQERGEMLEPLCLSVCKGNSIRSVLFFQGDDSSLMLRFALIAP
ncbi:MAG: GNAT family N-acetyltransferase, partial [Oscillospiraceae bacterium]